MEGTEIHVLILGDAVDEIKCSLIWECSNEIKLQGMILSAQAKGIHIYQHVTRNADSWFPKASWI